MPDVASGDSPCELEKNTGKILCRRCSQHITDHSAALNVDGAHSHTFTNPLGIQFTIACYQCAPGCLLANGSTRDFTWFDGYAWRIALCSHCRCHLGWRYHNNGGDSFFGLIVRNLSIISGNSPRTAC